ncbi:MAG: hypothetical protein HOD92_26985 [Deltaproteobacteria bacterium]|jgi:hypothetical protein|nr:hypothetical protein [Deltaproteobacteria bacterium]
MKYEEDNVMKIRKAEYKELKKEWFELGKQNGFDDVTKSSDLSLPNIIMVDQIDLEQFDSNTEWVSLLPRAMTHKRSGLWPYLDGLHFKNKLFDERTWFHGYIVGIKNGWAMIKKIVTESGGSETTLVGSKNSNKIPVVPPIPAPVAPPRQTG